MRAWARRASSLHDEVAAIADVDRRWWLVAGGAAAAESWGGRESYMMSDAEPGTDTFIGHRAPAPADPIRDAIARAHAARAAIRALDGTLPEQPLAVTLRRGRGATAVPSALDTAAFAIGDACVVVELAADVADEGPLAALLARPAPSSPLSGSRTPFVCVSIGADPIEVARHGHRRAWAANAGPWLGLGRTAELDVVSTCHMAVDGYGHTLLAAAIADAHARLIPRTPRAPANLIPSPIAPVPGAIPLGVAWRERTGTAPRALRLGYALGTVLHRRTGRPDARFSPTFQIPVAPGRPDEPERRLRRVVPSAMSVRYAGGEPEPFVVFEARARAILAREAQGIGLCSRLLAAARGAPAPLAWKRSTFSASRPRWLDRVAEVVGGRACLSRIRIDTPIAPSCAVSSPARTASPDDPLGACVITVIDDGDRSAITVCGSGLAGTHADAEALIDELLAQL